MKNLIFVGGIHGVGKTTFCSELTNDYQISAFSASKVISALKKQKFTTNKQITDIGENQNLLIAGINKLETSTKFNIIDGHFCLIDKDSNISQIPSVVFNKLDPVLFIVVVDLVENIAKRLKTRDRIEYSKSFIEAFQQEEINHATFVARMLNKPLLVHDYSSISRDELHNTLNELGVR